MNSTPARTPRDLLVLLPVIYVVFILGLFCLAWRSGQALQNPAPTGSQNLPITPPANSPHQGEDGELNQLKTKLDLQQDYLEKRSAQVDKRADDLEHLIVEMTVGSGIYTLLLGLFAYFSLKAIKSEAQTDLKNIRDLLSDFKKNEFADFRKDLQSSATREIELARAEFDSFRSEVRNDIPELYGMARSLGVILERIRRQVDMRRNWTLRESYEAMTDEQRQTILVAEMTIAGFDYFGLPASNRFRSVAAEIYLNLANFYASRSRMVGADGKFTQSDMKRAFLYIDRACATDPLNALSFSQRGALIIVDVPRPGDRPSKEQLDKAVSDLEHSLTLKPGLARSLYNLAWIRGRRGDFKGALEFVTQIIDMKQTLGSDDRGRRIIDAYTNRACYRAMALNPLPADAAQQTQIQEDAKLILADCEAACDEGKLYSLQDYCRKGFSREFAQNGDMHAISALLDPQAVAKVIACA